MLASLLITTLTALPAFAHGENLILMWFGIAWALPAVLFLTFPWQHPLCRWLSVILLSLGCVAFILVPSITQLVDTVRGGGAIALFGPAVVAFAISAIACRLVSRKTN